MNISKRLLAITAEGHYRAVYVSFATNKCLLEKSFLLPPSFSTSQAGWDGGSTAVPRSAILSLHGTGILWSALILPALQPALLMLSQVSRYLCCFVLSY